MSTDAMTGAGVGPQDDAPTTELVTGVVGDRCPNCQAPMAADQRYCLNCGERRGRARFSPEALATPAAGAHTETTVVSQRPPSRFSSGTTLVAGVATLLIALGVGVLIGQAANNNNSSGKAPAAQIITVGGGGGAAASTTAATPAQRASSARAAQKAKRTVVHITAKSAKAATAAASKVLGSSHNLSNNVQQSVGSSCSGGAGCQNGTFTGNYFPNG